MEEKGMGLGKPMKGKGGKEERALPLMVAYRKPGPGECDYFNLLH